MDKKETAGVIGLVCLAMPIFAVMASGAFFVMMLLLVAYEENPTAIIYLLVSWGFLLVGASLLAYATWR